MIVGTCHRRTKNVTIEMLIGEITEKIEKLETHLVVYQDWGSEGSSGNHDFLPYST